MKNQNVLVSALKLSSYNVRQESDNDTEFQELKASIHSFGLLQLFIKQDVYTETDNIKNPTWVKDCVEPEIQVWDNIEDIPF